jgi:putative ABC transport system ATP-binding protein
MTHSRLLFSTRELTKTYHTEGGEIHALRGVDVDLYERELVVMLGPSGSGKSTFLNLLGGLDVPTSGKIYYRNKDLAQFSERQRTGYRRDSIGFVFQFYNLTPSLTARENISLATDIVKDSMSPDDALALVGLSNRKDHFPSELSGGEQQRVAVARAIAKRPSILLCDEPTGALDSRTGIKVLEAIDSASRSLGTTTVLITHNASIADMADRVIAFADGHIADIKANPSRRLASELAW